jgi:hypothetical protein
MEKKYGRNERRRKGTTGIKERKNGGEELL